MAHLFQIAQTNCVLVTPSMVPGVVNAPAILKEIGTPTQTVQLPELQLATYGDGLQITYLEVGPQRCNLTVTQGGEGGLSARWERVARLACQHAAREQPLLGFGFNFACGCALPRGQAAPYLKSLLDREMLDRLRAAKIRPETAGMKIFYLWGSWRVTLAIDPDVGNAEQLIANANFHRENPKRNTIARLVSDYGRAQEALKDVLSRVLPEEADDDTN